jgi:hypothetical protein
MILLASAILLALCSAWMQSAAAATRLVSVPVDAPGLTGLGIALDHSTRQGDRVVFEASEYDLRQLAAAGIPVETLVDDLESFYRNRALSERELWEAAPRGGGFGFGSMGGYYTWAEVVTKLNEMRANYPQLITAKQSLNLSHQGRDVWMVKISDNADQAEGEPAMLYTALTHAREPQGMATVLYYMFYLLENYGVDPEATYLVDNRELYFVPVLNPDGYVYNQTTDPQGGGFWRKNRRNNGGGSFGVDLNRNYSFNWGYDNNGSSPNSSSDTYRGPGPFSEPETQAIRVFHQGRTIWNAFHYHTYGNYEIHPFGHLPGAFPPQPDFSWFLLYGDAITDMNGYLLGNAWQTVNYTVNGDAVDYSYGEQVEKNKVFAFTPEVGSGNDGFWPAPSRIVPLAQLNLGPNLYYAWITGARVVLAGVEAGPEVPAGATSTAVVELDNHGLGAHATDVTLTLETDDPFVTIAEPVKAFPPVPPRGTATNAGDPLEFFVSGATPQGHGITFDLTVRQGQVVRATTSFQVTATQSSAVDGTTAPAVSELGLRVQPNPIRTGADLTVSLPEARSVRLVLYDVAGRARRVLADGMMAAGEHRVRFDGRDGAGQKLSDGVYLARLEGSDAATEIRIVIIK